jgi:serine/threonine protein kinase
MFHNNHTPILEYYSTQNQTTGTLSRQHSTLKLNGLVFDKKNAAGKGAYGKGFVFEDEKGHKLFVKEELPQLTADNKNYPEGILLENTAKYSQELLGFGALIGDPKKTDRQHYVVEEYIPGTPLNEFSFKSYSQFLKVCLSIFEAIKKLHDKKIVHGDVYENNIMIQKDKNEQFKVTFIDFDFTKKEGEPVLFKKDKYYKSPEYSPQTLAHSSQDIYCLGDMIRFLSHKNHYNTAELTDLYTRMLSIHPHERPTAATLIRTIKNYQAQLFTHSFMQMGRLPLEKRTMEAFKQLHELRQDILDHEVLLMLLEIFNKNGKTKDLLQYLSLDKVKLLVLTDISQLPDVMMLLPKENKFSFFTSLQLSPLQLNEYLEALFKNFNFDDVIRYLVIHHDPQQMTQICSAPFIKKLILSDLDKLPRLLSLLPYKEARTWMTQLQLDKPALDELIRKMYKYTDFEKTLHFIDIYCSLDKAFYRQAILSLNAGYRLDYCQQQVTQNCLGWYGLFGLSHKKKYDASQIIENCANEPNTLKDFKFRFPVFQQGKINEIVERLIPRK